MLPSQSLEEAQISLGRNLTCAETLWYNYSARKSDYFLYCHAIIFLFVVYTLMPLPYMLIELASSKKIDHEFKIQPRVTTSFSKMLDCYRKTIKTFVYAVVPLQLLSFPFIERIGIRTCLPLPSGSEVFWQLLVYCLVEDYATYWIHRMLHFEWGYEKIHKVHHEYNSPIGFAAPYAHWAEVLILGFASFLGPVIVPGHMVTFWLWIILREVEAIDTHCGYDFPWFPTKFIPFYGGPVYHDYHHYVGGNCKNNFGSIFTYCDYIYGTYKGYRYHKEVLEKIREREEEKWRQHIR